MPKNLVLLSDGTGNSAASAFKTNVWRLYQAVDIDDPPAGQLQQVAFYHDGVGTGTFRPLVLLGLALGIGVARNVKELYTFLCRNYEPGDSIYLFGFSRGAFTVRILGGLLSRCGLVTADSEAELAVRVKLAYAEYKRDVARRATATRPWLLAGRLLGGLKRGGETDHVQFDFPQQFPRIRFIGVWDTVDAYGMPVDELKMGIDRYIWPMTLADRHLSDHIDRACHALSLDDERPTFRPVLWTRPAVNPERLSQVWFAGVHADVGGGYPDDGLAYVALDWMMNRAGIAGLRFYPGHIDECRQRANANAPQHDSRAGLAGYYRYGPRNVDELCDDPAHGVSVYPCVHGMVLQRLRDRQAAYAPVSFPARVAAGSPKYDIEPPRRNSFILGTESAADVSGRAADSEAVTLAVIRRKFTYFTTVAATLALVALPFVDALAGVHRAPVRIPWWSAASSGISAGLAWLPGKGVTPGWATFWLRSFAVHPTIFTVCGTVALWLFVRTSAKIQDQIFARAEYAFRRGV